MEGETNPIINGVGTGEAPATNPIINGVGTGEAPATNPAASQGQQGEQPNAEASGSTVGGEAGEQGTTGEAEKKPAEEAPAQADYKPIGNEALDEIGLTLHERGLDISAFVDELRQQFSPTNSEVLLTAESAKELEEKFGKNLANLIEKQMVSEVNRQAAQIVENRNKVYSQFGGEDGFIRVATAVKESGKVSEEDMVKLGNMLAKGGIEQETAINKIKEVYMSTEGFQQDGNFQTGGEATTPMGIEPISRSQFTAEKMKAMREKDHAKVEQLNKRASYTLEKRPEIWR